MLAPGKLTMPRVAEQLVGRAAELRALDAALAELGRTHGAVPQSQARRVARAESAHKLGVSSRVAVEHADRTGT